MWNDSGSLAVLIKLVTTEENYELYVGGNTLLGRTKENFHSEVKLVVSETKDFSKKKVKRRLPLNKKKMERGLGKKNFQLQVSIFLSHNFPARQWHHEFFYSVLDRIKLEF